jgi:hypothetical protein
VGNTWDKPRGGGTYGSSSVQGARAGESFKTGAELEEEQLDAEYAKTQGATGIAGGGRRATPEYRRGLAEFKAQRRRKSSMTGADAADALAK